MRYTPAWSPDGKRLAFSDKDGKVFVLTLADKSLAQVADDPRGQVHDYTWSPCGTHLAFSLSEPNENRSLFIWSVGQKKPRRITGEMFDESDPAWDPDGNYLYYLSDREFAPQVGGIEFNFLANRSTGLYALALRKDVKNPFPPESDEVDRPTTRRRTRRKTRTRTKDKDKRCQRRGGRSGKGQEADRDRLRRSGRSGRPGAGGGRQLRGVTAIKGHLLYVRQGSFYYGRDGEIEARAADLLRR